MFIILFKKKNCSIEILSKFGICKIQIQSFNLNKKLYKFITMKKRERSYGSSPIVKINSTNEQKKKPFKLNFMFTKCIILAFHS